MLARDAADGGIEILLVQRAVTLRFMGGMYVFPGGAVHASDADPAIASRITAPAHRWPRGEVGDGGAPEILDVGSASDVDRAYAIAAVRETCEEVALLLGVGDLVPAKLERVREMLASVPPSAANRFSLSSSPPGPPPEREIPATPRSSKLPDESIASSERADPAIAATPRSSLPPGQSIASSAHLEFAIAMTPPSSAGPGASTASSARPELAIPPNPRPSTDPGVSSAQSALAEGAIAAAPRWRPASLAEALAAIGARLDLSALVPLSRWITPASNPIRFDTRFYVARAPSTQDASADGTETSTLAWLSPARALAEHRAGRIVLSPPTRRTLEEVAELSSVNQLLAFAASRPAPCIEPTGARAR